jgi:hypothetical protein
VCIEKTQNHKHYSVRTRMCVRACITTKNKQTPFYGAAIGNAMLKSKLLEYLYLPTKSTV